MNRSTRTHTAARPLPAVSERVVARLALYRRILLRAADGNRPHLFSHEIAAICGTTSAQVRRDLMAVGFAGHPVYGYDVAGLLEKLDVFLDKGRGVRMALVGVGNLGRALLSYFNNGRSHTAIVAAFDSDPARVNRTIGGCHCYPIADLRRVVATTPVDVAVIAVPSEAAQEVAGQLVAAGVRSLLNLAPVRLHVPRHVYVEDVDLGIAIEKAAFYARSKGTSR
jgi:redox-sensing transcriptional repressor